MFWFRFRSVHPFTPLLHWRVCSPIFSYTCPFVQCERTLISITFVTRVCNQPTNQPPVPSTVYTTTILIWYDFSANANERGKRVIVARGCDDDDVLSVGLGFFIRQYIQADDHFVKRRVFLTETNNPSVGHGGRRGGQGEQKPSLYTPENWDDDHLLDGWWKTT